jgi:hypothetical protein
MAGLAIAALLGSSAAAAAGTAALVSSAATGAQLIGSAASSFGQARKARVRGEKAQAEVKKRMAEAKRRIDVNTAEQLSVPKEPYQLMRRAGLTAAATGLQAGVEGETRGAAATVGRVQMAQQQQEAEIAAAQSERMFQIDQLKAEEEKRIAEEMAFINLEESAGAQQAVRYAEEDRATALKEGFGTIAQMGGRALESFAAGNFADNELAGLTKEQRQAVRQARRAQGQGGQTFGPGESSSQLLGDLARGPEVDLGSQRQQRRSANQSEGVLSGQGGPVINTASAIGGTFDFVTGYDVDGIPGSAYQDYVPPGRTLSPAETRQLNRANREIATANRQNQRELNRLEGQQMLPTQRELGREMAQERRLGQQDTRDIQRVLDADARELRRQQQPGLPPPMDINEQMATGQFDAFGGGGSSVTPEELERRITENARREGAGPVRTEFPAPFNTDVLMDAEIRRATERRGGMSFIPDDPLAADLAAFYGEDPPARTPVGPRREGDVGDPMKVSESKLIPLSNSKELISALGSEAPEDVRVNLDRIANSPIAQPSTPEFIETANAEGVAAAAEAGPASAELAEVATSNTNVRNPLAVAMQWLGIREPDYGKMDSLEGQSDSTYVRHPVPITTPEGEALTLSIWGQIGHSDRTAQKFMEKEAAWCAGFSNKILQDSLLTALPAEGISKEKAAYSRGRAVNYLASEFGENVFTSGYGAGVNLKGSSFNSLTPAKATGSVSDGKLGDVVVVRTNSGMHVAFFAGIDEETGKVRLLGGNQNNEVNISAFDQSQVLGIRRVRQPDLTPEEQERISSIIVQPGSGSTR